MDCGRLRVNECGEVSLSFLVRSSRYGLRGVRIGEASHPGPPRTLRRLRSTSTSHTQIEVSSDDEPLIPPNIGRDDECAGPTQWDSGAQFSMPDRASGLSSVEESDHLYAMQIDLCRGDFQEEPFEARNRCSPRTRRPTQMDIDSDVPIRRNRVVPLSSNSDEDVSQPECGSPHSPIGNDGESRKRQRFSQATTVPPESALDARQGDFTAESFQSAQRRVSKRLILMGGTVDPHPSLVDAGDESVLVERCARTPRSQERIADAVPVETSSPHRQEEEASSNEQSDKESISGVSEVECEHEQPSPPDPVLIPDSIRNAATGRAFRSLDLVNLRDMFEQRANLMKAVPQCLRGPFRAGMRLALAEVEVGRRERNELRKLRGWKLFMLLPRKLLFRLQRGGLVPKATLKASSRNSRRENGSLCWERGAFQKWRWPKVSAAYATKRTPWSVEWQERKTFVTWVNCLPPATRVGPRKQRYIGSSA